MMFINPWKRARQHYEDRVSETRRADYWADKCAALRVALGIIAEGQKPSEAAAVAKRALEGGFDHAGDY